MIFDNLQYILQPSTIQNLFYMINNVEQFSNCTGRVGAIECGRVVLLYGRRLIDTY